MSPTAQVRLEANLPWRYIIGRGGNYVAVCDALSLTVQSRTFSELTEDINDILNVMLIDLLKANELDGFLRNYGWTLMGQIPREGQDVKFDIPLYLIPQRVNSDGLSRDLYQ